MNLSQQIKKNEKNVRDALDVLSKQASELNLKQFNSEDVTNEIKKYRKTIEKYKKAMSGLNTAFKFMKTKNVMTIDDILEIENELKDFEIEFQKITKYANVG